MKTTVEQINAQIEVFVKNSEAQLNKGNKAAGTRARKAALELSKLMKTVSDIASTLTNYTTIFQISKYQNINFFLYSKTFLCH